jgi:hypothetical protein
MIARPDPRPHARRVQPISVRSGAGYRDQLLSNRLITAEEITAASVNGSTT